MITFACVIAAVAVCTGVLLAAQDGPRTERYSLALLIVTGVTAAAGLTRALVF